MASLVAALPTYGHSCAVMALMKDTRTCGGGCGCAGGKGGADEHWRRRRRRRRRRGRRPSGRGGAAEGRMRAPPPLWLLRWQWCDGVAAWWASAWWEAHHIRLLGPLGEMLQLQAWGARRAGERAMGVGGPE